MNKNIKTIILVVVLAILGASAYFLNKDNSTTFKGSLRDFAYADTASISKFTISDTEGNSITISRDNPQKMWMVDGTEYKATPASAQLILKALKRTVIRQDLDEAKIKTTLEYLAVRHKKVAFYKNGEDKPFKTWYIGNATPDHQGTFMLLQNGDVKSHEPFIAYMPGVRGTLDARFFTDFKTWRHSGIYNYGIGEIRKIKAINRDTPNESFEIDIDPNSALTLKDGYGDTIAVFDTAQVAHYVTHFKKLHFNHVVEYLTEKQVDSVMQITPNFTFEVTDKNNETKTVDIWKILKTIETDNGIEKKLDVNYAFASINKSKELVRLQYYQWDNVLKPLYYFLPRQKNK